MTLSSTERSDFERDGVIGPFPRFAKDRDLDEIVDFVRSVVEHRPAHPIYGHHPQGRFSVRDWHLVHDPLRGLLTDPAIADRLESIADEPLVLWRTKVFHKPPRSGSLAWHQEWGAFNGEEVGNDRPALVPRDTSQNWNWTVWVALQDMTPELGPVQFIRGSHRRRYPWQHVPMTKSAFFTSFLDSCRDVESIVSKARANNLFLDLDTHGLFDASDVKLPLSEVRARVQRYLEGCQAKLTLPFEFEDADRLVFDSMKRGEFLIFTERTMHGSLANTTDRPRLAVNARVTAESTVVYPQRFSMAPIDGSNLDIRRHRCVPLGRRVPAACYRTGLDDARYGASPNARLEATST